MIRLLFEATQRVISFWTRVLRRRTNSGSPRPLSSVGKPDCQNGSPSQASGHRLFSRVFRNPKADELQSLESIDPMNLIVDWVAESADLERTHPVPAIADVCRQSD